MASVGSSILVIRRCLAAWSLNSEGFVRLCLPGEAPNLESVRSGNLPFPVECGCLTWMPLPCKKEGKGHFRTEPGVRHRSGRFTYPRKEFGRLQVALYSVVSHQICDCLPKEVRGRASRNQTVANRSSCFWIGAD